MRLTTALGLMILLGAAALTLADSQHDATVRHDFKDIDHWVERFESPEREAWQKPKVLMRFLGLREGEVTADLGAGTGYFTLWLSTLVGDRGKTYAVDIEPAMIEYIEQREFHHDNVVPVLADPDDPKLPEGEIDLVLVVNTWHHIDDRIQYLGKLAGSLSPSGRLALVDWREGELPEGPPPGHKLSRAAAVAEFEKAGWRLDSESVALPYQYVLIFLPPEPAS